MSDARPGDVIQMADGVYRGRFVADRSGTDQAPITLCGTRAAVLDAGSITTGYGFALRSDHWVLIGFTVRNALKGIMADEADFNVLRDLEVHTIGGEGVHFRRHSSDNRLEGSWIHDVGLHVPSNGEGVYVGSAHTNWSRYTNGSPDRSDRNQIVGNKIGPNTSAESIDIKEGTSGGRVHDNRFLGTGMTAADSWVDVKGNDWTITANIGTLAPRDGFQTHAQLDGWGMGNVFAGNKADVRASGYGFRIDAGSSGNAVRCDNTVERATQGFANIACG